MKLPIHIDLSRFSSKRFGPDPERDWLILLSAALLLLAASALGNAFIYMSAVAGAPAQGAALAPAEVPADALSQVEGTFSARATEAAKYETGAYSFVDPSK